MNKYKFIYMWWFSVLKDEEIVEAETEEEAYKNSVMVLVMNQLTL